MRSSCTYCKAVTATVKNQQQLSQVTEEDSWYYKPRLRLYIY